MPDVADRHADAQLAAARLGAGGVEHAGAQHAELELADAALHAEQQPIVRPAGVVDAVQVDHPRLDQAAQLEQVMPVAAVAGEPGGVEAQHSADLAGAEPRHEPLEAGPRHHAAGGAAEIVVDHLDVAEAPAPGDVDELVLAPLALEIGLDLGLGGLPNIDHRLALQHRGRQEISARHRHAPRVATPAASSSRLASRASDRAALRRAHPAKPCGIERHAELARRRGWQRRSSAGSSSCSSWTMVGSSRELRLKPRSISRSMQISQRRYRHARRAELHAGAGGGIEHPCRHHDDDAGRHLDVDDIAAGALLAVLTPNAAPIQRDASDNGPRPPARHGQNDRVIALGRKNSLFAGSDMLAA